MMTFLNQNPPELMTEKLFDYSKKMDEEKTASHHKRPARLLPFHLLYGDRRNVTDDEPVRRFYGPPTNCSELSQLGYTLNGFYLVKTAENNHGINMKDGDEIRVKVISCTFKYPKGIYTSSRT